MIVVKKPETSEVAGHVPDDLERVLFRLLITAKALSMKCEITGLSKAARKGFGCREWDSDSLHVHPLQKESRQSGHQG